MGLNPEAMPTRKITVVGIGGAVAAIIAWVLGGLVGVDVPAGVESAFAVLAAWLAGYFTSEPDGTATS